MNRASGGSSPIFSIGRRAAVHNYSRLYYGPTVFCMAQEQDDNGPDGCPKTSASHLKIAGDCKIDRHGSSRRAMMIDLCRLGLPILLHIFGISIVVKHSTRTTRRRIPVLGVAYMGHG